MRRGSDKEDSSKEDKKKKPTPTTDDATSATIIFSAPEKGVEFLQKLKEAAKDDSNKAGLNSEPAERNLIEELKTAPIVKELGSRSDGLSRPESRIEERQQISGRGSQHISPGRPSEASVRKERLLRLMPDVSLLSSKTTDQLLQSTSAHSSLINDPTKVSPQGAKLSLSKRQVQQIPEKVATATPSRIEIKQSRKSSIKTRPSKVSPRKQSDHTTSRESAPISKNTPSQPPSLAKPIDSNVRIKDVAVKSPIPMEIEMELDFSYVDSEPSSESIEVQTEEFEESKGVEVEVNVTGEEPVTIPETFQPVEIVQEIPQLEIVQEETPAIIPEPEPESPVQELVITPEEPKPETPPIVEEPKVLPSIEPEPEPVKISPSVKAKGGLWGSIKPKYVEIKPKPKTSSLLTTADSKHDTQKLEKFATLAVTTKKMFDSLSKKAKEKNEFKKLEEVGIPDQRTLLDVLMEKETKMFDFGGFLREYFSPSLRTPILFNFQGRYRGTDNETLFKAINIEKLGTKEQLKEDGMKRNLVRRDEYLEDLREVALDDDHFQFLKGITNMQPVTCPLTVYHGMLQEVVPMLDEVFHFYLNHLGQDHKSTLEAGEHFVRHRNRLNMYDNL